jgi:hypothetical protein
MSHVKPKMSCAFAFRFDISDRLNIVSKLGHYFCWSLFGWENKYCADPMTKDASIGIKINSVTRTSKPSDQVSVDHSLQP